MLAPHRQGTWSTVNPRSFVAFLLVGGSATALHYALIGVLVLVGWVDAVTASAIGYVLSAMFNYFANARITFEGRHHHSKSIPRFAVTTGLGCALNTLLLKTLILVGFPFVISQLFATGVVLLWNYTINALWTFRSRAD